MELVVILADHGMVRAVGWCCRDGWGDLVRMISGVINVRVGLRWGRVWGWLHVWYHTRCNGEESRQGNIWFIFISMTERPGKSDSSKITSWDIIVGNKTIRMFGSFGLCIEYIF